MLINNKEIEQITITNKDNEVIVVISDEQLIEKDNYKIYLK